jgi:anaerobic magnesium-protoporphyrin IX monomethyl ester cyclase
MNVVLVNPPPPKLVERWDKPPYPHLGLACIASYLKSKGIACNVIDAKFEGVSLEEVETRLRILNPTIVGITSMTHEIYNADAVAQLAKKINPQVITVIGGCHVTALPLETMDEFKNFDVAIIGEGEYTFADVVNKNLEDVEGIAWRKGDEVKINKPREPIQNLDDLPMPAWELFPKSSEYPMVTARGCPYKCNFCMRVMGNKVRKRSPQNVVAEMKKCVNAYHPKILRFMDETFTVNKSYLNEVLDLIITSGLQKKVKWDAQTRVDLVDEELLRKMKTAGCFALGFGVESGNQEILKNSGKNINLEQVVKATRLARKVGLQTEAYFIFGHPFETYQTAKDTINFAAKINTTKTTFGIMVPYPGTQIYELAKKGEGGYILISDDWRDYNKNIGNSLELKTLSRKQMERFQIEGYIYFYLRNLRFVDGAKYLVSQRRLGASILKKALLK